MNYYYKHYNPRDDKNSFSMINDDSGIESIWKLPPDVFNPSKSKLEFTLSIQQSVDFNTLDGYYTYVWKDIITPIRTLQLYTSSNTLICDIQNFNYYSKVVRKPCTTFTDFMTKPLLFGSNYSNNVHYSGTGSFLQPNNQRFFEDHPEAMYVDNGVVITMAQSSTLFCRNDGSVSNKNYIEPQYFEVSNLGIVDVGGNDAVLPDMVFNISIELRDIKNSFFSLNRDVYFGENETVYLKITWNGRTSIAFAGDGEKNPSNNPRLYNNVMNIENIHLVLACQQDEVKIKNIKNQILTSGLSIPIDYNIFYSSNVLVNGPTFTIKYNRIHGQKLKYIFVSFFTIPPPNAFNKTYDCSNVTESTGLAATTGVQVYITNYGRIIRSFYTSLDDKRLQDMDIDTVTNQDYIMLYDDIKESVLQDTDIYAYNWVWIENFCNEKPYLQNNETISGISLDVPRKYVFTGNVTNNNLIYYVWTITQKLLTINKYGITCV